MPSFLLAVAASVAAFFVVETFVKAPTTPTPSASDQEAQLNAQLATLNQQLATMQAAQGNTPTDPVPPFVPGFGTATTSGTVARVPFAYTGTYDAMGFPILSDAYGNLYALATS